MLSIPGRSARLLRPVLVAAAAAAVSATLPLAPAAADGHRTVVGTLVQAWPEQQQLTSAALEAAPLSWVKQADGRSVRVSTADLADVPAGSTVQVTVGDPVRDAATNDQGYTPASEVLSTDVLKTPDTTAPTDAPLTDQVTIAMVVPAGGQKDGATLGQLVSAVNGPVADFWAAQSHGAIRLGVTAKNDWITTSAGCGDPTALWAETAAKVGFTPGPGRHLVVYVSSEPDDLAGCSYGLGQVGSGLGSGGSLYVRDTLPSLIAHELGHNWGLGHSSERECDGTLESGSCQTQPYRDYYDVMGASWEHVGSLNAAQAAHLGVLPASAEQSFASDRVSVGGATLAPLSGSTGTRAVRLTDAAGADYWLEYRSASGQDAWLGTTDNRFGLQTGVLLHRSGQLPDTSLLLDGTPSKAAAWPGDLQVALPVGTPITVAGGQFTITVESLSASGAALRIATAPAPGVPAPAAGSAHVLPGRKHPLAHPAPGATAAADQSDASAVSPAPILLGSQPHESAPLRSELTTTSASRPTGLGSALWFAAAGLGGLLVLTTAALRRRMRR